MAAAGLNRVADGLTGRLGRLPLVVLTVVVVQLALVADLRLGGATGDIVLLLAIGGGLTGGPERGAVCGFAAGLAFDLVLATPFGLSALAFTVVGYVAGKVSVALLRARWWMPFAIGGVLSAIGVGIEAVLGLLLGDVPFDVAHLAASVGVVSMLNALACRPALRLVRWAFADGGTPRHAL